MKGIKYDNDKPMWDLLPLKTVEEVVKVMTLGTKKYPPNNWKKVRPKSRYFSACLRHLTAYQSGEKLDKETGLSHLAHAICCLLFLLWIDLHYKSSNKEKVV